MLRSDCRVIQTGRYAVGREYLAVSILKHIGACSMENSYSTSLESCRMPSCINALPSSLDSYELNLFVAEELMEDSNGIAPAANAGDDAIRQAAFFFHYLFLCLHAYNALKVSHHHRVWMRSED